MAFDEQTVESMPTGEERATAQPYSGRLIVRSKGSYDRKDGAVVHCGGKTMSITKSGEATPITNSSGTAACYMMRRADCDGDATTSITKQRSRRTTTGFDERSPCKKCSGEKVHNSNVAMRAVGRLQDRRAGAVDRLQDRRASKSPPSYRGNGCRRLQEYKESTSEERPQSTVATSPPILPWWQQVRLRSPGVATTTATSPQFYRGKAQECKHRSASTGLRRPRGHLSTLLGGANNTTINQDEEPLPIKGPR
jgi:hypothetical protein